MKVLKNYLYNVSYQVFLLIIPLVTMPYITRVIGPHGVGINTYTYSIIQYFVLFGSLGLSMYGNREIAYHRENKEDRTRTFIEIQILFFILISLALISFVIFFVLIDKYKIYYLAQSVAILAAVFDISWFFMGLENFRIIVLRNFLIRIAALICIFVLVHSKHDLFIYILINTMSSLIGNISLWPYLKPNLVKIKLKSLNVFRHFLPALILFIPQVATNVYVVLNKTMLGQFSSVESAGFFDNSDKIIKMTLALLTSLATVMMPKIAGLYSKNDTTSIHRYVSYSFNLILMFSIPLMFGFMAIGQPLSIWFFGKGFGAVGNVMVVEAPVIVVIACASVIGNQFLLPTNKNKEYTLAVVLGAIVNVIINLPLIIFWGAIGTAISTVISECVVTGFQFFSVRKDFKLKILFKELWKYMFAGLIMFATVHAFNSFFVFNFLILFVDILLGTIIYFSILYLEKSTLLNDAIYRVKKSLIN